MMIEAGITGIECLDPPPLGNVRLAEAKKLLKGKAFLKGNIDPVNVLLFGSREAAEKDAERRIKVAKPGGGFILSTACSVAPHTKRENVQALARVVEKAGYY
jgi:uroporphyrinogen decarboxylase